MENSNQNGASGSGSNQNSTRNGGGASGSGSNQNGVGGSGVRSIGDPNGKRPKLSQDQTDPHGKRPKLGQDQTDPHGQDQPQTDFPPHGQDQNQGEGNQVVNQDGETSSDDGTTSDCGSLQTSDFSNASGKEKHLLKMQNAKLAYQAMLEQSHAELNNVPEPYSPGLQARIDEHNSVMLEVATNIEVQAAAQEGRPARVVQVSTRRTANNSSACIISYKGYDPNNPGQDGNNPPPGGPLACLSLGSGLSRQLIPLVGVSSSSPPLPKENFFGLVAFGVAVLVVIKFLFKKK